MTATAISTSWHDSNRGVSIFISIYIVLYLVVVFLSKWLHQSPMIARYLPEAGMVLIVGMIAGGFAQLVATNNAEMAGDVAESILSFGPSVFFIVLLPPIIFNSGYHLNVQLLWRYFTPICLFAFLGTMVSMFIIAGILHGICTVLSFSPTFNELLAFGALISATDPVSTLAVFSVKKVDPQLFYMLSGESLLNDAVGLVLFEAFAHLVELESLNGGATPLGDAILQVLVDVALNFGGSFVMGILLGIFVAFVLKVIDLRHTPMLELSAYVLIMYAPFVLAEICRMSGIVTVLFTGLAARRYAEPNLSKFASENSDTIFRLVAHVTETLIFLEMGLSVITILRNEFNIFFVLSALLACLIARALNVYPIAIGYNICQKIRLGSGVETKQPSTVVTESNGELNDGIDEALYYKDEEEITDDEIVRNDAFIPWETTHFLFLSGLRGAVSYGLVKMFPDNHGNKITFEVTTMIIVLTTTFVFGGFTDYALTKLNIAVGVDEDIYRKSLKQGKKFKDGWLGRFESRLICPFVLRDFSSHADKPEDDFIYQEQVEVVDEPTHSPERNRKIVSIYDFGQ